MNQIVLIIKLRSGSAPWRRKAAMVMTHAMFAGLLLLSVSYDGLSQTVAVVEAEQIPHTSFKAKDTKKEDRHIEASAVERIDPGKLLVADDKSAKLLVVNQANGEVIGDVEFAGITGTPDWEAMAQEGNGTFYVAASHDPVIKFRLENGVIVKDSVVRLQIWKDLKQKGEADSTQIEGLAVIPSSESNKNAILIVGYVSRVVKLRFIVPTCLNPLLKTRLSNFLRRFSSPLERRRTALQTCTSLPLNMSQPGRGF
jgi:hypothetical protein